MNGILLVWFSSVKFNRFILGNDKFAFNTLSSENDVLIEKYRAVTIISLNRPDRKNALSKTMLNGLATAIRNFDMDATSSVGILCGIGGNFSIGYDLDELRNVVESKGNILENITVRWWPLIHNGCTIIYNLLNETFFQFEQNLTDKPMICCISGYCLSLAFELALMCDIRFVEENSVMQLSNRMLGIPLVNGGSQRLAKLISLSRALDLTLTGREIRATEAHEIGLASCVVTEGSCKNLFIFCSTKTGKSIRCRVFCRSW